jgi:dipeptidyl aminopeptidase/acylaminoacyl peptidase
VRPSGAVRPPGLAALGAAVGVGLLLSGCATAPAQPESGDPLAGPPSAGAPTAGASTGAPSAGARPLAGADQAAPGASAPAAALRGPGRQAPVLLGSHNDTSTPFNLVSVKALAATPSDGRDLRLRGVRTRTLTATSYDVSYRSADLTVTGVMDVPNRAGRHPLVVLAHGWTDPTRYRSGAMLQRERESLAARDLVALQIDYRNHAGSSREAGGELPAGVPPLGYAQDLVNAVRAVERADLPFVDSSRIGLFGRSMGGGVVLDALAARPDLADAAVLYAPVSSRAADNFRRFARPHPDLSDRVAARFGTPAQRPRLWREASSRSRFDLVDVPVQLHHGTADTVCPVAWSRATAAALRAAGGQVELHEYPGEGHRFGAGWPVMRDRAVAFLQRELGA